MTELVRHDDTHSTGLAEQMDYARAVSTAALLPQAYRGRPADIMLAVGLGQSMGLSPAESLYRIDVIQGKPTASAELIAANVRKAGHKLRLRVDEQAVSATCTIIRADDPDYEHTVTRDQAWAQKMGLASKDNYKKQPATMLGWRAVTACARMACPEALYGVAYTSDEMYDAGDQPVDKQQRRGLGAVLAEPQPEAEQEIHDAEIVETGEAMTDKTRGHMFALFDERGITDADQQRAGISAVIGREIASRGELTEAEGQQVIASLKGGN